MTEESKAYWAWLQLSLGAGSFKPKRILSYFPDISSFYDAGPVQWRSMGLFTPKELKQLSQNTLEDGKIFWCDCDGISKEEFPDYRGISICASELRWRWGDGNNIETERE